jgi:hypothetical protein
MLTPVAALYMQAAAQDEAPRVSDAANAAAAYVGAGKDNNILVLLRKDADSWHAGETLTYADVC